MFGEDLSRQFVVPLRSFLRNLFVSSEPEQLCIQTDVCHPGLALLHWNINCVSISVYVGLIVRLWIVELLLLNLDHDGALSAHLIKFLQQLITQVSLMLVESLHCGFDLLNRVQLQSLLIDWINELVHAIEEHLDVLFDLLVAHQVLEVAI